MFYSRIRCITLAFLPFRILYASGFQKYWITFLKNPCRLFPQQKLIWTYRAKAFENIFDFVLSYIWKLQFQKLFPCRSALYVPREIFEYIARIKPMFKVFSKVLFLEVFSLTRSRLTRIVYTSSQNAILRLQRRECVCVVSN